MPNLSSILVVGVMIALYYGYPAFQTLTLAVCIYVVGKVINALSGRFGFVRKDDYQKALKDAAQAREEAAQWESLYDDQKTLFEDFRDELDARLREARHNGKIDGQNVVFMLYHTDKALFNRHYQEFIARNNAEYARQKRANSSNSRTYSDTQSKASWQTVLGVPRDADEAMVKQAYKDLVREWHPDRHSDPQKKDIANKKMRDINAAHDEAEKHFKARA